MKTNVENIIRSVRSAKNTVICFTIFFLTVFIISSCGLRQADPEDPGSMNAITFNLFTQDGTVISTTSSLFYTRSYRVTVAATGVPSTAVYRLSHAPSSALSISAQNLNGIDFTVNNTPDSMVTITAIYNDGAGTILSNNLVLNLISPNAPSTTFAASIAGTTVPPLTNVLVKEVLEPLSASAGATLEKRYVTEAGAGSKNGTSWTNAWTSTNLRNAINAITDASATKVYLIMVAGGTYKPTYDGNRSVSFSMKNYVAIMGGFDPQGGWERIGTTAFSGDIGVVNNNGDNSYQVFNHNGVALNTAHLYGVTIAGGNANAVSPRDLGGGMYNSGGSTLPVLTRVVFSDNNAAGGGGGIYNRSGANSLIYHTVFQNNSSTFGGGMFNDGASPVLNDVDFINNRTIGGSVSATGGGMRNEGASPALTNVKFISNMSQGSGGGMYNTGSSPVLTRVMFSGNTTGVNGGGIYNNGGATVFNDMVLQYNSADWGGGVYNTGSLITFKNVVFRENKANRGGGGMLNASSSPAIVGAVFTGNEALNGGGMLNNNNGQAGPLILNSIFSGNLASFGGTTGAGPDIAVNRDAGSAENIRIAGSVLGIGQAHPTNGIVGYNGSENLDIRFHLNSLRDVSPNLGPYTTTGMLTYPTIQSGSSPHNLGLHVRKNGSTYYFSEDTTTWYTGFTSTGIFDASTSTSSIPANAENLTATDIVGNARNARPDAGVYEVQ